MSHPARMAHLVYSILCDDVRIEAGNRLSLMGVFENLVVTAFPCFLLRLAVVNHWVGAGDFETQVRILAPDGREVVVGAPSKFHIDPDGYADNVTLFTNVVFDRPGQFRVEIALDGESVLVRPLFLHAAPPPAGAVN